MFIKLSSHRCRDKVIKVLGYKPKEFYSMERPMTYGCFDVTPQEFDKLKASGIKEISKLRGPFDDVRKCIQWN